MIECANGLGHSFKAHRVVPGWSLDVIDWNDGELVQRSGWRGGEVSGGWVEQIGRVRQKLTGGVHEG